MTAAEEIATNYVKISSAAEILGVDAATVYRLYARKVLRGLTIDSSKFIEIGSLREYAATRVTAAA